MKENSRIVVIQERLAECRKNKERIDAELGKETQDEVNMDEVNERYTYFATLQSWLKDYTHFINTKYTQIEDYVKTMREYKAEMASIRLRKRQLDVKDSGLQE